MTIDPEAFRDLAYDLCHGAGDPAELRTTLIGALAALGVEVTPASSDAAPHSLLYFVDEYGGEGTFLLLPDAALSDLDRAALEVANGKCAADPADLDGQDGPMTRGVVRVLGLGGVHPQLDAWFGATEHPEQPDDAEIARLDTVAVAAVSFGEDGPDRAALEALLAHPLTASYAFVMAM